MRSLFAIMIISLLASCSGRSKKTTVIDPPKASEPAPVTPSPDNHAGDGSVQGSSGGEQISGGTSNDTQQIELEDGSDNVTVDPNKLDEPSTTPVTPSATQPQTTTVPTPNATGTIVAQGTSITFQDLRFTIPDGWKLHQETVNGGVMLMGFSKGSDYFRIYAKKSELPALQSIFVNGSQVVAQDREEKVGDYSWKRIDTQKGQISVAGFALLHKEHAYYGFARSSSQQTASTIASLFLGGMK